MVVDPISGNNQASPKSVAYVKSGEKGCKTNHLASFNLNHCVTIFKTLFFTCCLRFELLALYSNSFF